MIVSELIEKLKYLPGHLPVHIAIDPDGSGGGVGGEYLFAEDVETNNFPTYGRMAVITINYSPTDSKKAWTAP